MIEERIGEMIEERIGEMIGEMIEERIGEMIEERIGEMIGEVNINGLTEEDISVEILAAEEGLNEEIKDNILWE
jgi:hypothetical protein